MKVVLNDRMLQGAIAGFIAEVIAEVFGFTLGALNLSMMRYVDYAGILILGHEPRNVAELVVTSGFASMFAVMIGVIFAYAVPFLGTANLYIKSWLFSLFVWYVWYSILTMTFTDKVHTITYQTAISNFIVASVYGILLGVFYRWLRHRYSAAE